MDDLEAILITEDGLKSRVAALGAQISHDYQGKDLVLIGILKGGIIFLSDLCRAISIPHQYDLVGAQSYKGGTRPTPNVQVTKDLDVDVSGKHVLIIEDIYDTGNTLRVIRRMLEIFSPASVEVCALLSKRKERDNPLSIKYVGFDIEDVFVVGYGLDYKERYRSLKCIGVLHPEIYQ